MRLDQDKQIKDLATFQRNVLDQKEITKMAIQHLKNQGFSPDELRMDKQRNEDNGVVR